MSDDLFTPDVIKVLIDCITIVALVAASIGYELGRRERF